VHCTTQGVTGHYVCSSDVCSTASSPVKKSLHNIEHFSTPSQQFCNPVSGFHFKMDNLYIHLTLTIVTTLLGFETLAIRISFAVENNRFGYAEKTEKIQ